MNVSQPFRSALFALTLVAVSAAHADTVFGDDFSSSLASGTASSTDYTLVNAGVYTGVSQYRVISNPGTTFTNGYTSYFDHTTGTANGAMLFFDGAPNTSTRIYDHSVTMTAGTPYTISYWGAAADSTAVPVLYLSVNGGTIGSALTTIDGQWQQSSAVYTPTTSGTYTLAVYDSVTDAVGNDGSLDDFLVTAPAATPEPAPLAALGLGAAAILRRRKRA